MASLHEFKAQRRAWRAEAVMLQAAVAELIFEAKGP